MFKVKNRPLLASELDVLYELRAQLKLNGVHKFKDIKPSVNNIQFTCPNDEHKGGQEAKPSCGVSIVDVGNTPAGTVHCFKCGYVSNLEKMISYCFGYDDDGKFGESWLIRNFMTVSVENRKPIELQWRNQIFSQDAGDFVSEKELQKYRYSHPYMYKRKLTDEIIEKFDVGYDRDQKCVTFPVWDVDGNCVFIARRSVQTKFFNYPFGVKKPVYGANFLEPEMNTVIICESIFNALTCWVYGKPAVALLGLGNKDQYEILKQLKVRKYILALDPDPDGQRATAILREQLKNHKIITQYRIPLGKDVNDLDFHQFSSLVEIY